jgi:hypothetical protein
MPPRLASLPRRLRPLLLAAAAAAVPAFAVEVDPGGAAIDAQGDAKDQRPQDQRASWNVGLGLSVGHDEFGNEVVTTPFVLAWQSPGADWWKVQLRSDGWTRTDSPAGQRQEGTGSLGVAVVHHVASGVSLQVGLVPPSGGDTGSKAWSEIGRLLLNGDLGARYPWFAYTALKHLPRRREQVSDWTEVAYGQVGWRATPDYTLSLGTGVQHTQGFDDIVDVAAVASFNVNARTHGQFAITRGVASGQHHTGVRFDLNRDF